MMGGTSAGRGERMRMRKKKKKKKRRREEKEDEEGGRKKRRREGGRDRNEYPVGTGGRGRGRGRERLTQQAGEANQSRALGSVGFPSARAGAL